MKRTLIYVSLITALGACGNQDPTPMATSSANPIQAKILTDHKEDKLEEIYHDLAGRKNHIKKYDLVYYYNDGTNTRFVSTTPSAPIASPDVPNTFYWDPAGFVMEYNYEGLPIDTGAWILTSRDSILFHTNLSQTQRYINLITVTDSTFIGTFIVPTGNPAYPYLNLKFIGTKVARVHEVPYLIPFTGVPGRPVGHITL